MKRLCSIASAALLVSLAFSARCDTEIYLNLSDLTWVGSGTEFYSSWAVAGPDRTDFGAWMHLDASYAASISNQPAGGTNFVYQWSDWRGNGTYARQDSFFTSMPFVSNALQNGKSVVRFQPFSGSSGSFYGPSLTFSEVKTDIFAVFAVVNLCNNCEYVPLLGGASTVDFCGATGGQLIHEEWSNVKVYNGTNAMDGVLLPVTEIFPTNAFHVVSVRTFGGGVSADNLGRDRSFRSGGIDFAELIVFTNPVSDAVTSQIEAYLKTKWATP